MTPERRRLLKILDDNYNKNINQMNMPYYIVGDYYLEFIDSTIFIRGEREQRLVSLSWMLPRLKRLDAQPILDNLELFRSCQQEADIMDELHVIMSENFDKGTKPTRYVAGDYQFVTLMDAYWIQIKGDRIVSLDYFIQNGPKDKVKVVLYNINLFKKYQYEL